MVVHLAGWWARHAVTTQANTCLGGDETLGLVTYEMCNVTRLTLCSAWS